MRRVASSSERQFTVTSVRRPSAGGTAPRNRRRRPIASFTVPATIFRISGGSDDIGEPSFHLREREDPDDEQDQRRPDRPDGREGVERSDPEQAPTEGLEDPRER